MTATATLPDASKLASLPDSQLLPVLDALFEPSPALQALALPLIRSSPKPLDTYADLIGTLRGHLLDLAASIATDPAASITLHAILASHPRLGAPKVDSAQSAAEQAQLQDGDTAARLAKLNAEYEEAFPGLRYVVFVNGRGRGEIMADMRRRIDRGDVSAEEREAIEAMCEIATDRAKKLQRSPAA